MAKNKNVGSAQKTGALKTIPIKPPVSPETYIAILRGFIEAAYEGKMTFLDISAIIDGEIRNVKFYSRLE